jgi:uncharacterized protein YceH (UPF0502 family)
MSDAAPAVRQATRWQPIAPAERRVLGVLIEKAKTTPENYPLSLNSLRTGCNQKNNRAPLMQLEDEQVEAALETLRRIGAVSVVQGSGRVDKYRHLAYEWLGVEKVELAVITELLLRGAQSIGELRGRAARMEPIKDLGELRPVLDSLQAKRLIAYLTPEGRGCIVTHALYQERELEKLSREAGATAVDHGEEHGETSSVGVHRVSSQAVETDEVTAEVAELRAEMAAMKRDFQAAQVELGTTLQQLRRDLEELNRQLGN